MQSARILPCGRMVALRRRGAAPAADEVLGRHRRQQQGELQHRRGAQLRHGRWVRRVSQPERDSRAMSVCFHVLQHQSGPTLRHVVQVQGQEGNTKTNLLKQLQTLCGIKL